MNIDEIKTVIECVLMSSQNPITIKKLINLFKESGEDLERGAILQAIDSLRNDYEARGIEICEVASGFRIQVRQEYAHWLHKLLPEKPERYSQALLETLALIAYRQPITRGEIEQIRGVSVSTQIMRTLLERRWVKVLGQKEVPGKPSLYGTTPTFLSDFNLLKLNELPELADFTETEERLEQAELDFENTANQQNQNAEEQEEQVKHEHEEEAAQAVK